MGPWGPKMGVPPKKAPIFKEDAFPSFRAVRRPVANGPLPPLSLKGQRFAPRGVLKCGKMGDGGAPF